MTIKDRIEEFENLKLISNQRRSEIFMNEDDGLNNFFKFTDDIREKIKYLDEMVNELDTARNNIVCETYSNKEINTKVINLITNFDKNVQLLRKELKNLEKDIINDENYPNGILPTIQKIKKLQFKNLIIRFRELIIRYNKSQEEYKTCCKKKISRTLSLEGYCVSEEQLDEMVENGVFNIYTRNIHIGLQLIEDVKTRHCEILKLEKSITELFTLFQDILLIVDSQGELIDRIEENVELAEAKVFQARKYAILASRNRKRLLKAQIFCGFLCVLLIVLAVLLLFSYFK
uniref:t-SNARE coiled-coil homology domain-containing protein n=1 Tax=Parastrongyloides trichosuri TaxID=131310 RepID=A0A0N5A513_PARTI